MQPTPVNCLLPKAPNTTNYHGKVVVFTAFYEHKGHAPYITSMIETAMYFERLGIAWDYWHIFGDFHFDRALNQAMTNFMRSDFTDIILIDSDEKWSAEGVLRLLAHEVDVVAGSYRVKNDWEQYTGVLMRDIETGAPQGRLLADGTGLIRAERIPGGFTRFTKLALQMFYDEYPELHYADGDETSCAFFHTGVKDGRFFSHDYLLSERWKAIGVELWIDPAIDITHYGTVGFEGNLDRHMRGQVKEADALEVVKQMAADIASRS